VAMGGPLRACWHECLQRGQRVRLQRGRHGSDQPTRNRRVGPVHEYGHSGPEWPDGDLAFGIQQPPGAANWAIGCQGARQQSGMPFGHKQTLPEGIFDSHGTPVAPASLYLAQLRERLGSLAVKKMGISARAGLKSPSPGRTASSSAPASALRWAIPASSANKESP